MVSWRVVVLGVVGAVAVTAIVAYVVLRGEPDRGERAAGEQVEADGERSSPAPRSERGAEERGPRPATKRVKRMASAEARERLVAAIAQARREREGREGRERRERLSSAGQGSSARADGGEPSGRLSADYIRDTVREAVPLIRECYDLAMQEQDPYEGTLTLRFTIAGEPDVGGLVEEAEVDSGEGQAPGQTLLECLRETTLSLEFEPPEGGGSVQVSYPLRFSQSEDAGARQ